MAPSASSIELGEQSLTDTPRCGPDGGCVIAATPVADSVPSGPAWPTAKMLARACSWPRLAWGTTTSVSLEVVTGTRVPPDVTRVKPVVLASDTVPWTGTKPKTVSVPRVQHPGQLGVCTRTEAAATVYRMHVLDGQ
jgi:hypothetical protein